MARMAHRHVIYEAAARFVEGPLIEGSSLFGYPHDVWTLPVVDNLYHRLQTIVGRAPDDIVSSLRECINASLTDTVQFAAELLFVHLLFESSDAFVGGGAPARPLKGEGLSHHAYGERAYLPRDLGDYG